MPTSACPVRARANFSRTRGAKRVAWLAASDLPLDLSDDRSLSMSEFSRFMLATSDETEASTSKVKQEADARKPASAPGSVQKEKSTGADVRMGFTPRVTIISCCDLELRRQFCSTVLTRIPSDTRVVLITVNDPGKDARAPPPRTDSTGKVDTVDASPASKGRGAGSSVSEAPGAASGVISQSGMLPSPIDQFSQPQNVAVLSPTSPSMPAVRSQDLDNVTDPESGSESEEDATSNVSFSHAPRGFRNLELKDALTGAAGTARDTEEEEALSPAWYHCESITELYDVVRTLSQRRDFDCIFVEMSGLDSMKPRYVAQDLHAMTNIKVDSLVTVIDGDAFIRDFNAISKKDEISDTSGEQEVGLDVAAALSADFAQTEDGALSDWESPAQGYDGALAAAEDAFERRQMEANSVDGVSQTPGQPGEVEQPAVSSEEVPENELLGASQPVVPAETTISESKTEPREKTRSRKVSPKSVPESMRLISTVSLVEDANMVVACASGLSGPLPIDEETGKTELEMIINILNRPATVITAPLAQVPCEAMMNTALYDPVKTELGASWRRALFAEKNTDAVKLGKSVKASTLVYRSERPFRPESLYDYMKNMSLFDGVMRSRGRLWIASRNKYPLLWEQAGDVGTLSRGPNFRDDARSGGAAGNRDERFGGRTTEIVFVGRALDKERIRGLLDSCLLNDEEMVFTNKWESLADPFDVFVPLESDDEDDAEEDLDWMSGSAPNRVAPAPAPAPASSSDARSSKTNSGERQDANDKGQSRKVEANAASDTLSTLNRDVGRLVRDRAVGDAATSEDAVLSLGAFAGEKAATKAEGGGERVPSSSNDEAGVLVSWDTETADSILQKVPSIGLPVTLITGFLGAGKSSLINHILNETPDLKIAVLVNEFGEINIDKQIVSRQGSGGKDWVDAELLDPISLENGCICCSINRSFQEAVEKILALGDRVDYLLVETSGVADPVPILNTLNAFDLSNRIRMDGIISLIDASNFDESQVLESETMMSQVFVADTFLMSKTDITPPERVEEIITFLKSKRPGARILKVKRGVVPVKYILDVGLRLSPEASAEARKYQPADDTVKSGTDQDQSAAHECAGDECDHESHRDVVDMDKKESNHLERDGFQTISFRSSKPFNADRFMDKFLQQIPPGVYRAKGLLLFSDDPGSRSIFFSLPDDDLISKRPLGLMVSRVRTSS
ncbi:putative metal chaperone YciC [Porphyridium purpureum]|uniref:Putative metal chaperone YciC n=1 Tax=Porphyridium purpureum TaxID=35688 RepID=A0A5J4Z3U1_PORPP|nr:putative metal chaperone YciC [Porphyridium purpureum]|eukprot:POR8690..scf295_1